MSLEENQKTRKKQTWIITQNPSNLCYERSTMAATVNIQNNIREIIVVPFDISVNWSNKSSGSKVVCYYLNWMLYATNKHV